MSVAFIRIIDRSYRKLGYDDRSKFIRTAVREKLINMGVPVPLEETLAPERTRYPGHQSKSQYITLNDKKPNSKLLDDAAAASDAVEKSLGPDPKSPPAPSAAAPSDRKSRPSPGTSTKTKGKPSPPKPAPK